MMDTSTFSGTLVQTAICPPKRLILMISSILQRSVETALPAPLLRARSIDSINAVDSGRARLLPDEAVMRLT